MPAYWSKARQSKLALSPSVSVPFEYIERSTVPLSETSKRPNSSANAERAADRGVDRQRGEAVLDVRAAGIVGR